MVVKPDTFQNEVFPEEFQLPDGIKHIGDNVFRGSTFNGDIRFPVSVIDMGKLVLSNAILKKGMFVGQHTTYIAGSFSLGFTYPSNYH